MATNIETPPESYTDLPPTPPLTDEKSTTRSSRVTDEVKRRREGHSVSTTPWLPFELDASEYRDLQILDEGFATHKLRWDYFPSNRRIVFRMPSGLHEDFTLSVVKEILNQLNLIGSRESPSGEFARNIKNAASATIRFDDFNYGKHDPDGSFRHSRAQYPGVVIEVSYSQKRRDLKRLAEDYILGSNGNIRAVVGLDVEYTGRTATISIWRPRIQTDDAGEKELVAEQVIADQIFRDADGKPDMEPQRGLYLQLEDFATTALVETYDDLHDVIFISSEALSTYLNQAEDLELMLKQKRGVTATLGPGVRKRRRQSTPTEELRSDRETSFQDDERRALKRATKDDSSYKASSTSEAGSN